MKERICESCGTEFEVEAGDDSVICAACMFALQKEKREDRSLNRLEIE